MKITYLLYFFSPLSETFIVNQIVSCIQQGHEVKILYLDDLKLNFRYSLIDEYNLFALSHKINIPPGILRKIINLIPFFIHLFLINPFRCIKALSLFKYGSIKLLYCLKLFNYFKESDIIHAHFEQMATIAVAIREYGAKGAIVTSFHGGDCNLYSSSLKRRYRKIFSLSDLITANSQYIKSKLINLGCPDSKIVIIPETIDVSRFKFRCRKRIDREIRFLTVARLVEKKGIEYSLRAFAKVFKNNPLIHYAIVGDGPLKIKLYNLAEELQILIAVDFKGALCLDKVIEEYEKAHIFILASCSVIDRDNEEGQGVVLQEAQAVGLPVIATRHNGFPEGVVENKSAFLVPERNVEALAEKMTYLIEHPELWREMGIIGRKFVEDKYDMDVVMFKLDQYYKQIVKKKTVN